MNCNGKDLPIGSRLILNFQSFSKSQFKKLKIDHSII